MQRRLIAILAGTVTLMVMGFLFWGVLLETSGAVRQVANEDEMRTALRDASSDDGAFFVPMEGFGGEEFSRRHAEGPVAMVYLRPNGAPASMGGTMAKGFVHFLLSATFAVWLWKAFARDQGLFSRRFAFLFLLGLFTALVAHPANRVWWHYPMNFTVFALIANAASWAAAAVVMAAILRPEN